MFNIVNVSMEACDTASDVCILLSYHATHVYLSPIYMICRHILYTKLLKARLPTSRLLTARYVESSLQHATRKDRRTIYISRNESLQLFFTGTEVKFHTQQRSLRQQKYRTDA